jgi:hypothetical protein
MEPPEIILSISTPPVEVRIYAEREKVEAAN